MVELVLALIIIIVDKATDIIEHHIGFIHKPQPPRGGVGKELIAEAATEAGYDFKIRH